MIARLVRSADFERVLRTRTRASTQHFAVHHVADRPSVSAKAVTGKLSTGGLPIENLPVDESKPMATPVAAFDAALEAVWLGAVVPKRHARRSVTRTLLKRQIRAVVTGHLATLAGGLWVVRLRGPFDRARFASAASDELKRVVREELESLIGNAAQRVVAGA